MADEKTGHIHASGRIDQLKKVSEVTMIPQAKLVEKALEDLIDQYAKK